MSDQREIEKDYIKNALYHGRSPNDLHSIIDKTVVDYVRELRGASIKARHCEAQRDILCNAASKAVDHLRQLGEYGGANKVVEEIDNALRTAHL